ncbi:MAG: hypothetical protein VKJ24_07875 [Synechococcales bacterium]|nr:hypothetical protein [Synechococcales bacterium]
MAHQTIGKLGYQLYCLGWQNSRQPAPHRYSHFILSLLFYYRRGFQEGRNAIALFQSNYIQSPE